MSWRIYNQVDVVPHFPIGADGSYQPVTAGYAINSLGKAKWSLRCAHALSTYLHVLSPATVPLNPACTLSVWQPVTALPASMVGVGRTAHVTGLDTAGPPGTEKSGSRSRIAAAPAPKNPDVRC